MKVNSTPKIIDIREMDVPSLGKKALAFDFEFLSEYTPDVASIKVTGEMLYLADKPEEIIKKWKKDKGLPTEVSVEVLNTLFRKCLLKASNLAEDLQLPPPLDLPRIVPKPSQVPEKEAR